MFQASERSTAGVSVQPAQSENRSHTKEPIRHMLFGSPAGVRQVIHLLHKLGYAEPNDWSRPMPTGRPGEVMAILTRYWVKDEG
ncbi:MAG: hypothetical protein MJA27_31240 [Pseudanabaenales cyanobacterium]|nr:hypothetical protein [Pseudanabaenales cyanobacterium]